MKWVCIRVKNGRKKEKKKSEEVRNERREEWRTYEGMRVLDLMDLDDESEGWRRSEKWESKDSLCVVLCCSVTNSKS